VDEAEAADQRVVAHVAGVDERPVHGGATASGDTQLQLAANLLLFDALHAGKSRIDLAP